MGTSRRRGWICAIALASALAAGAQAQTPPPGGAAAAADAAVGARTSRAIPELEPQVTIIRRDNETREEVRVNGQLRYIKVTPRFGLPYYLVPSGTGSARRSCATIRWTPGCARRCGSCFRGELTSPASTQRRRVRRRPPRSRMSA